MVAANHMLMTWSVAFSLIVALLGAGTLLLRPLPSHITRTMKVADDSEIHKLESSFRNLTGYSETINLLVSSSASSSSIPAYFPTAADATLSPSALESTIDNIAIAVLSLGPDSWSLASKIDGWAIDPQVELQVRRDNRKLSDVWISSSSPPKPMPLNDSGPTWSFYDDFLITEREADRASSVFGNVNAALCVCNLTISKYFWMRRAALNITAADYDKMSKLDELCLQESSKCNSAFDQDHARCLRYAQGEPRRALEYISRVSPTLLFNEHASGRWASGLYTAYSGMSGQRQGQVSDHGLQLDYVSVPGNIFNYYGRGWKGSLAIVTTAWAFLFASTKDDGISMFYSDAKAVVLRHAIQCFAMGDYNSLRTEFRASSPTLSPVSSLSSSSLAPFVLNTSNALRLYRGREPLARNRACQTLRGLNFTADVLSTIDSIIYCDASCRSSCNGIPSTTGLSLFLQEDTCSAKNFKSGLNITRLLSQCYNTGSGVGESLEKGQPPSRRVLFLSNVASKTRYNISSAFDEIIWLSLQIESSMLIQEPQLTRAAKSLEYGGLQVQVKLHQTSGQPNSYSVLVYIASLLIELMALVAVIAACQTAFVKMMTEHLSVSSSLLLSGFGSNCMLLGPSGAMITYLRIACLVALYSECLTLRVSFTSQGAFSESSVFDLSMGSAAAVNYGVLILLSILVSSITSKACYGSVPNNRLRCLVVTTAQVVIAAYTGLLYTTALGISDITFSINGSPMACNCKLLIAAGVYLSTYVAPFYAYSMRKVTKDMQGSVPELMRMYLLPSELLVGPTDCVRDSRGRLWVYWTILTAQTALGKVKTLDTDISSTCQEKVTGGGKKSTDSLLRSTTTVEAADQTTQRGDSPNHEDRLRKERESLRRMGYI